MKFMKKGLAPAAGPFEQACFLFPVSLSSLLLCSYFFSIFTSTGVPLRTVSKTGEYLANSRSFSVLGSSVFILNFTVMFLKPFLIFSERPKKPLMSISP